MDALKYFRIEAQEHLEGLNAGLLELERAPSDAGTLRTLFRLAHTLKGSARMVSLDQLGTVAHKIEDVLGVLRDEGVEATETVISSLLAAVETVERMVAALDDKAADTVDVTPVLGDLEEALAGIRGSLPEKARGPAKKQASGPARNRKRSPAGSAVPGTDRRTRQRRADDILEPERGHDDKHLRVPVSKVDRLSNLTGELVIHKIRLAGKDRQLRALSQDALRLARAVGDIHEWVATPEVRETLAGTPLGERLHYILARARVVSLKEGFKGLMADSKAQIAQLDQIASSLHEGVMDLRMLPASTLVVPLQLVVRETSLYLKREARLEVEGESIEMDKALIEIIKEPLVHILRNAIGHGIESPKERRAAGKDPEGVVRLAFERKGAKLTITIADDGRGVDLERVREEALARGLFGPGDPALASRAELLRCLLQPGFSTVKEVTEVSGRGVGLDVVSARVRELTGSVEIDSAPGEGTRIVIRLPVNLSTMDGFLFTSNLRTYVVPLESVVQIRNVQAREIDVCARQPVLKVEDETVPYVSLERMLGNRSTEAGRVAVIFQEGDGRIAVGVDGVVGVRPVLIKPVPAHVGELPWVSGITVLASGGPAVILNVAQLFSEEAHRASAAFASGVEPGTRPGDGHASAPAGEATKTPTVLVVDDSLSVRMMEKTMLEAVGYRVMLAEDGEAALSRLAQGGIDLVLTDVEMPQLNGFELVRRIRSQPQTQDLPVVIVSSLGTRTDRVQGMEAGADAYLTKDDLSQETLRAAVERLVGI